MPEQPTRAERFRVIRDAIMAQSHKMRPSAYGKELVCGPYLIRLSFPGALGLVRGSHLDIWPGSSADEQAFGVHHGNKVCSVDWWQDGRINIATFRSAPWEAELLTLLRQRENVTEMDWHRRRRMGAPR